MRRKTLRRVVDDALQTLMAETTFDTPDPPCAVEIIHVVQVADYREARETFERQTTTIDLQRAEIAQLRMLLREALGQLERNHEISKIVAPDYRRLLKRANTVLDASTQRKDTQ